jgi:hypothetical protein
MTDAELAASWPELGALVAVLRHSNEAALADRLVERVQYASTSGEIFNGVGAVLFEHRGLRERLSAAGAAAWDSVMDDVERAGGVRAGGWLARRWRNLWRKR